MEKGFWMRNHLLERAIAELPELVGVGLVDIDTGESLGADSADAQGLTDLSGLANTTRDLFEGPNIRAIEDIFHARRGDQKEPYFKEILFYSKHLVHYFGKLQHSPRLVLAVVANQNVNIGMLLVKVRALLKEERPTQPIFQDADASGLLSGKRPNEQESEIVGE